MTTTVRRNPRYLIDTNCLVTPFNDYYRPNFDISSPFWERLRELVNNDEVGMLSLVADEVCAGKTDNDFLKLGLSRFEGKSSIRNVTSR